MASFYLPHVWIRHFAKENLFFNYTKYHEYQRPSAIEIIIMPALSILKDPKTEIKIVGKLDPMGKNKLFFNFSC